MTDVKCLSCGSSKMEKLAMGIMRCRRCEYAWQTSESWHSGRKRQVNFVLRLGVGTWIEIPNGCLLVAASEEL